MLHIFDKYYCECNDNKCELSFDDSDYEEAVKLRGLKDVYILHPNCATLNEYEIIERTDVYVIAKKI